MSRAYTVTATALALGVSPKWLDNVLSHNKLAGVRQKRQGIARRLSREALLVLALAIRLTEDMGLPTAHAIRLAEKLVHGRGEFSPSQGIVVKADLTLVENLLTDRLATAVEIAPAPLRGRPRLNKTGRLE